MTNTHDHPIGASFPPSVLALSIADQHRLSATLTAVLDELPKGSGALDTRLREWLIEAAALLAA